jgi:hypothetical protein
MAPRLRGNGPALAAEPRRYRTVPPPARRWTHASQPRHSEDLGSSARAEMVPARPSSSDRSRRLPRRRGDGLIL